MVKYYKLLNGTKSKDGGDFDYKDYLPKGNKPGKWLPKIKNIKMCERGYHVTSDILRWLDNATVVYEVEYKGKVLQDSINKICCEQIRLIKEAETNIGDRNSGLCNSGDRNSGHKNSGDRNSGHRNSGHKNSGYKNSGHCNSRHCNSGDWNSGDWNSGHRNSGHRNSGHRNSGYKNSGDCNSGYFNTDEPKVRIFNKETRIKRENISFPNWMNFNLCVWVGEKDMTDKEKAMYPEHETTGGYLKTLDYKEAWKKAFDNASPEGVKQTTELPNFDYEIFEEITGITKQMIKDKLNGGKTK